MAQSLAAKKPKVAVPGSPPGTAAALTANWSGLSGGIGFANDGNFLAIAGKRGEWYWEVRPSGAAGAKTLLASGTAGRKIDAQLAAEAASQALQRAARQGGLD